MLRCRLSHAEPGQEVKGEIKLTSQLHRRPRTTMTPQRAEVLFTATDWAYTIPAHTYTGVHPKERICWVHQSDAQNTPQGFWHERGLPHAEQSPGHD